MWHGFLPDFKCFQLYRLPKQETKHQIQGGKQGRWSAYRNSKLVIPSWSMMIMQWFCIFTNDLLFIFRNLSSKVAIWYLDHQLCQSALELPSTLSLCPLTSIFQTPASLSPTFLKAILSLNSDLKFMYFSFKDLSWELSWVTKIFLVTVGSGMFRSFFRKISSFKIG